MSFRKTSKDGYEWKPIKYTIDNVKYAVLLLNHSMDHLNGAKSPSFDNIWQKAERRLAVDGGAKYLTSSHRIPDILSGDFDSVPKPTLELLRQKGTQIIETPDQNRTDFTKAVQIVFDSNKSMKSQINNNTEFESRIESIVTIWSSMGRLDQVLANINTLYMEGHQLEDTDGQYVPIFLLQINGSITWLLNQVLI